MNSKIATKEARRTTMAPVTTMEELPVLSEAEREDLLQTLKAAESRIEAGQGIDYDRQTFRDRLVGIYRGAKR
jgi:hypothetical protein